MIRDMAKKSAGQELIKDNEILNKETYMRITAPQHIVLSHFKKHERITGFHEDTGKIGFIGSDKLLQIDTIYGTVQFGYNPMKNQTFIFASKKTSILDTVASKARKEIDEAYMRRALRSGTQNVAFTAKRNISGAVVLYKAENFPWSRRTIASYLKRATMESLHKTMPFLDLSSELEQRVAARNIILETQKEIRANRLKEHTEKTEKEIAELRREQTETSAKQNEIEALIYRKDTQRRLFFRRLNLTYDLQKNEMLEYYREKRRQNERTVKESAAETEPPLDNKKDE